MDEGASPNRTNFIKKFMHFVKNPSVHEDDVTEEEIKSMVNEGHEQGVLLASEAEMINNIFEFGDKEAKDIMTHRKNLIVIDGNLSYNDAVSFIIENSKSRYPVYLDDIDNIIGVLHIKDAFAFAQKNEVFRTSIKDIPNLIREVDFVPETLNIHTLFKMMQAKKSHMVIVVDEYGQTSGAVAMEDILEEIVGNIEDEHDEEETLIRQNPDGSYLMNGLASMPEVIELLGLPVDEDAFETLNGFLVSLLEKIPNDGETAQINMYGYDFNVLKVEDKMIREVLVRKSQAARVLRAFLEGRVGVGFSPVLQVPDDEFEAEQGFRGLLVQFLVPIPHHEFAFFKRGVREEEAQIVGHPGFGNLGPDRGGHRAEQGRRDCAAGPRRFGPCGKAESFQIQ